MPHPSITPDRPLSKAQARILYRKKRWCDSEEFKKWREENNAHLCDLCLALGLERCEFTISLCKACNNRRRRCSVTEAYRKSLFMKWCEIDDNTYDQWQKEWTPVRIQKQRERVSQRKVKGKGGLVPVVKRSDGGVKGPDGRGGNQSDWGGYPHSDDEEASTDGEQGLRAHGRRNDVRATTGPHPVSTAHILTTVTVSNPMLPSTTSAIAQKQDATPTTTIKKPKRRRIGYVTTTDSEGSDAPGRGMGLDGSYWQASAPSDSRRRSTALPAVQHSATSRRSYPKKAKDKSFKSVSASTSRLATISTNVRSSSPPGYSESESESESSSLSDADDYFEPGDIHLASSSPPRPTVPPDVPAAASSNTGDVERRSSSLHAAVDPSLPAPNEPEESSSAPSLPQTLLPWPSLRRSSPPPYVPASVRSTSSLARPQLPIVPTSRSSSKSHGRSEGDQEKGQQPSTSPATKSLPAPEAQSTKDIAATGLENHTKASTSEIATSPLADAAAQDQIEPGTVEFPTPPAIEELTVTVNEAHDMDGSPAVETINAGTKLSDAADLPHSKEGSTFLAPVSHTSEPAVSSPPSDPSGQPPTDTNITDIINQLRTLLSDRHLLQLEVHSFKQANGNLSASLESSDARAKELETELQELKEERERTKELIEGEKGVSKGLAEDMEALEKEKKLLEDRVREGTKELERMRAEMEAWKQNAEEMKIMDDAASQPVARSTKIDEAELLRTHREVGQAIPPSTLGSLLLSEMASWSAISMLLRRAVSSGTRPSTRSSSPSASEDEVEDVLASSKTASSASLQPMIDQMKRICKEREAFLFNLSGLLAPIYQSAIEGEIELPSAAEQERLAEEQKEQRRMTEEKIRQLEAQLAESEEVTSRGVERIGQRHGELRRLKSVVKSKETSNDNDRFQDSWSHQSISSHHRLYAGRDNDQGESSSCATSRDGEEPPYSRSRLWQVRSELMEEEQALPPRKRRVSQMTAGFPDDDTERKRRRTDY